LAQFAERIRKSKNPALVYGQEIERSGGWDEGIEFAEKLRAPVFLAPLAERASFPQTHPQFQGMLPIAIGPLSKRLKSHDLVIVIFNLKGNFAVRCLVRPNGFVRRELQRHSRRRVRS